ITKSIRQKELGKGYVTDSDGNESEFKHETCFVNPQFNYVNRNSKEV
ncbi:7424_t:CDS:2, partial [Entrophospora sp. SA101]